MNLYLNSEEDWKITSSFAIAKQSIHLNSEEDWKRIPTLCKYIDLALKLRRGLKANYKIYASGDYDLKLRRGLKVGKYIDYDKAEKLALNSEEDWKHHSSLT